MRERSKRQRQRNERHAKKTEGSERERTVGRFYAPSRSRLTRRGFIFKSLFKKKIKTLQKLASH